MKKKKKKLFLYSIGIPNPVSTADSGSGQRQLRASLLTTLESFGRFPVLSSCSASTD
ncbi:hypothetical protein T06_9743 [Trichinella sp. T6]|nr:hypothetical protein T06_9743 [Trichinella sp. T6]